MALDDPYRILDLDAGATDEEVKTAWRDLSKVWHPDRFANDRDVQRKAEEKLKAINEAYERIRADRERGPRFRAAPPRADAPEVERMGRGIPVAIVVAALVILARRPTFGGLIVAAVLIGLAAVLFVRASRVR
jgi:preprotein translocase subunit Sec63